MFVFLVASSSKFDEKIACASYTEGVFLCWFLSLLFSSDYHPIINVKSQYDFSI